MSVIGRLNVFARFKVWWQVLRDGRTPLWSKVLFVGLAGLYLLSPIDLMPELFLGPFGLVDDVLIVPALAWLATKFAPAVVQHDAVQYVLRKRAERKAAAA